MKKIVTVILEVIVVLLIFWFILGYINFGKITNGEQPVYVVKEKSYEKDGGNVKVYDNIIYKIVVYKDVNSEITYSLKLFFMKDV
ncbi:MAG: hypothetical protein PUC23_02115 [bacterium]|nr:hypothetical protein [bacterium]